MAALLMIQALEKMAALLRKKIGLQEELKRFACEAVFCCLRQYEALVEQHMEARQKY